MEIVKPQIQLTINKGEFAQLLSEAMTDADSSAAIKKVLNPLLANKFPQFPEFTVVTLGATDESGSTQVILKQPPVASTAKDSKEPKAPKEPVVTPIKSIEPIDIVVPVAEQVSVVSDDDVFGTSVPAYVDPEL